VEEAVFSAMYALGAFVKNKVGLVIWIHFWVLYSAPLPGSLLNYFFLTVLALERRALYLLGKCWAL
jgi:hypothetical protein